MKYLAEIIITVSLLGSAVGGIACTPEEFAALNVSIGEQNKKYFEEKSAQLESLLLKIETLKSMNDQEMLAYRASALNNPKAMRIYKSEKKYTPMDMIKLANEQDCKKLQNLAENSMGSAERQWRLVFKELEADVAKYSSKKS